MTSLAIALRSRRALGRARGSLAVALLLVSSATVAAQTPDSAFAVSKSGAGLFRINVDGGALFGGDYNGGTGNGIPKEGAGTRMMWYPNRAAFRAGTVSDARWDDIYTGNYSFAAGLDTRASGDNSTAFGVGTISLGLSAFAAGEDNTASGAASVALGYHAHTNARQGSFVFSDRSSFDTLRAGVNHSANWRTSGGFRIFTSSTLTTGVTIQSGAVVSNWGQSSAVISTSTGAYLSTSGVWTNNSDRNRKRALLAVDGEEVLGRLRAMPITTWSYKVDDGAVRHMGPMAQDFHAAFGLGPDSLAIGTVDADGVALAGVQALERRSTAQAERIARLERENAELRARLELIEAKVAKLP